MSIFTANPETLPELWPHALPHIERFSRETMLVSPGDLYRDVSAGDKQLWMVEGGGKVTAAVVTQVYATLKGRICCVWAAAGGCGIAELKRVLEHIEQWASGIGCVTIEVRGRRGWKRALPEFKESGVLLEKPIRSLH